MTPLAQLLRAQAIGLHAAASAPASAPDTATSSSTAATARRRVLAVCRLLNVLVTVRGHKTVVKFFPHEAADLELVLSVLLAIKDAPGAAHQGGQGDAAAAGGAPKTPGTLALDAEEQALASWEAQMMMLLWLSMLILIPFALSTVDSATVAPDAAAAAAAQ